MAPSLLLELLGQSPGIVAVRETAARLLQRQSERGRLPPVLIQGETGVGKGLLARVAPPRRAPRGGALRRRQLRGHSRDAARGRALRLRARRLHGRAPREGRALPDRQPRHDLPGRGGPPAGGAPGQAPQGARGPRRPAARQHPERARRRLDRHGQQREPRDRGAGAAIPRGPLPPPRRRDADHSAVARPGRGRAPPRRALPRTGVRGVPAPPAKLHGGRADGAPRLSVARERAGAGERDGARRAPVRGAGRERRAARAARRAGGDRARGERGPGRRGRSRPRSRRRWAAWSGSISSKPCARRQATSRAQPRASASPGTPSGTAW